MPPLSQTDLAVYYDRQLEEHRSDYTTCAICHRKKCRLWREAYATIYGRVEPMRQPAGNDGEVNRRYGGLVPL
jgi:hypothetical protein